MKVVPVHTKLRLQFVFGAAPLQAPISGPIRRRRAFRDGDVLKATG